MAEELEHRLQRAVARRDDLNKKIVGVQARKIAAEQGLASVEAEIRAKNLDPDKLDETVAKLEKALLEELSKLESDLEAASATLQPYLENSSS